MNCLCVTSLHTMNIFFKQLSLTKVIQYVSYSIITCSFSSFVYNYRLSVFDIISLECKFPYHCGEFLNFFTDLDDVINTQLQLPFNGYLLLVLHVVVSLGDCMLFSLFYHFVHYYSFTF